MPEDTVDVMVRFRRTLRGTHTLKEDWEYYSLMFRLWEGKTKPFEALNMRLSNYLKRQETVTATAAASVPPTFHNTLEEEKRGDSSEPQNEANKIQVHTTKFE